MRKCRHCSKLLPASSSRQRLFCPDEPGRPRCRDLARKQAVKAKGNPDHLPSFHRFAPKGAVGFRIRLVVGDYSWTGPRLGVRSHKNASGSMRLGDFYWLDEKPRVPRTETYFIDYVDDEGALVLPIDKSPMLKLQVTGGSFRDQPSQSMRAKIKCLDEGRPLPPARKRVYELARELGMLAPQLLRELPRLGIPCENVQNSLGQAQIDVVLRRYSSRLFQPEPDRTQTSEPHRLPAAPTAPAAQAEPFAPAAPTSSADLGSFATLPLDECLPVPPMIRPEHDAASAYAANILGSAALVERDAGTATNQQLALAEDLGKAVDQLAGIVELPPSGEPIRPVSDLRDVQTSAGHTS